MVYFLCEGWLINISYCQYVCVYNHENHCQNVLPCNVSPIFHKIHLTILLFSCFYIPNKCPPGLLIFKYPHNLKLIRMPVYSFLDLINLTRYLLSSNFSYLVYILAYYIFSKSNLYSYVLLKMMVILLRSPSPKLEQQRI